MSKSLAILTQTIAILVIAPMIGVACGGTLGMFVYGVARAFIDFG